MFLFLNAKLHSNPVVSALGLLKSIETLRAFLIFDRVPTHPGNFGKWMTNFSVLENTWKMRVNIKCP